MDKEPSNDELETQMNLSLAFANDIISTYLGAPTPSRTTITPTQDTFHHDLKAYTNRPPRLGVGATVPKNVDLAAQARLKKAMENSKHLTKGVEPKRIKKTSHSDDDDEDSRTGSILKKPRLDPFHNKKGVKREESSPPPPKRIKTSPRTPDLKPSTTFVKKEPQTPRDVVKEENQVALELLVGESPPKDFVKPENDAVSLSPFSTPGRSPKHEDDKAKIMAQLQAVPLLNLDGPPPPLSSSPKKRRKKNQKKKHGSLSGAVKTEA